MSQYRAPPQPHGIDPSSGQDPETGRDDGPPRPSDELHWAEKLLAPAFAAICLVIVLASPRSVFDGRDLVIIWPPDVLAWANWVLQLHWIQGFLVIMPFLISGLVMSTVLRPRRRDFRLVVGDAPTEHAPRDHAAEDAALWARRAAAVEMSWEYERDRILRSHHRLRRQALIFGSVATFALACCALALPPAPWGDGNAVLQVVCSVAAAVTTAFLGNLVRVTLRISGGDATNRTFAWATRSLVLVIIADMGLYVILGKEMTSVFSALLLGIFVGATGDHAIQFLLDRGAKAFGAAKTDAVQQSSPLLDLEGMTAEHVERLEEEGILSIHDLAFVPTARLFFATAYSLQQICDWQDRALLLVYVGPKAAAALAEKMDIRGVIDLRAFAHDILFNRGEPHRLEIEKSLRSALGLDEGGF
ncbi:MAG TPA: hypothetical protein VFT22_09535, partial [Kofleriaceae bacterium]|nr:hypothetical protein [Kofleriaceae bacterium]